MIKKLVNSILGFMLVTFIFNSNSMRLLPLVMTQEELAQEYKEIMEFFFLL